MLTASWWPSRGLLNIDEVVSWRTSAPSSLRHCCFAVMISASAAQAPGVPHAPRLGGRALGFSLHLDRRGLPPSLVRFFAWLGIGW